MTALYCSFMVGAHSGSSFSSGVSHESFPLSTRSAISVAVIAFVHDPRCQASSSSTSSAWPFARTPVTHASSSPSVVTIAPPSAGSFALTRIASICCWTGSTACVAGAVGDGSAWTTNAATTKKAVKGIGSSVNP